MNFQRNASFGQIKNCLYKKYILAKIRLTNDLDLQVEKNEGRNENQIKFRRGKQQKYYI